MALAPYALCTVAEFKTFRDPNLPSSYDALIEMLINYATDRIEKYLGGRRIYNPSNDTIEELYDGDTCRDGKRSIFLKNYPVNQIVKIEYSLENNYGNPTYQEYSNVSDYTYNKRTGEVRFFAGLPYNIQTLKVSYKAGFAEVPSDIKVACIQMVATVFDKRKSQGISIEEIGSDSIEWELSMSHDLKQVLDSYKSCIFV